MVPTTGSRWWEGPLHTKQMASELLHIQGSLLILKSVNHFSPGNHHQCSNVLVIKRLMLFSQRLKDCNEEAISLKHPYFLSMHMLITYFAFDLTPEQHTLKLYKVSFLSKWQLRELYEVQISPPNKSTGLQPYRWERCEAVHWHMLTSVCCHAYNGNANMWMFSRLLAW